MFEEKDELESPIHSFDAMVWAKSFISHYETVPNFVIDEEIMISWFANALMRGYDEGYRKALLDK